MAKRADPARSAKAASELRYAPAGPPPSGPAGETERYLRRLARGQTGAAKQTRLGTPVDEDIVAFEDDGRTMRPRSFAKRRGHTLRGNVDDFRALFHPPGDEASFLAELDLKRADPFRILNDSPTVKDFTDFVIVHDNVTPDPWWESHANATVEANGGVAFSSDPAKITQAPTATSKPSRPRTVAAGYDKNRSVLTLVFRDGTYYNYYDVSNVEWQTFRGLSSKWKFIRDVLDQKKRGVASDAVIDPGASDQLYRITRAAQVVRNGKIRGQTSAWRGKLVTPRSRKKP